jgi:hypothetical protein
VIGDDQEEAARQVERQRREAVAAVLEADQRRRWALAYAGGPLDPRAQGLWDAAACHAERARAARARLAAAEALAEEIRSRAESRRAGRPGPSRCG